MSQKLALVRLLMDTGDNFPLGDRSRLQPIPTPSDTSPVVVETTDFSQQIFDRLVRLACLSLRIPLAFVVQDDQTTIVIRSVKGSQGFTEIHLEPWMLALHQNAQGLGASLCIESQATVSLPTLYCCATPLRNGPMEVGECTLICADVSPRVWSGDEKELLNELSGWGQETQEVWSRARSRAAWAEAPTSIPELLFQTNLLESQIEASPDGVLVVDRDARVLLYNHRFVQMWKIPPEVVATRSDEAALRAVQSLIVDPQEFMQRVDELYDNPFEHSHEEIELNDGRTFDRYSSPVTSRDNIHFGRVWFFRDITDRKAAKAALEEHIAQLQVIETELHQAVRAREEFLSIASHELKTPVTTLHLQVQGILRTMEKTDRAALEGLFGERLRKTEVQVKRLIRLIDNLLDVSRITSGRLELELEEFDLTSLVNEVVERFRDDLQRAGCALTWQAEGSIIGTWDRIRLDQVLTNLLSNAIKYGRGNPIELSLRPSHDSVRIEVKDYGIGISKGDLERVFQRFERAVSERQYGGFGLGLWITHQIVIALGGNISVESKPAVGSLFTVELPLGIK